MSDVLNALSFTDLLITEQELSRAHNKSLQICSPASYSDLSLIFDYIEGQQKTLLSVYRKCAELQKCVSKCAPSTLLDTTFSAEEKKKKEQQNSKV